MIKKPLTRLEKLKLALDEGHIDQEAYDLVANSIQAAQPAHGAHASGRDAPAVGPAAVLVNGNNQGAINTGIIIQQGTVPGASEQDLRRAYLARILTQTNQLPLFAGDSTNIPIQLSSVYTALLTQRSDQEDLIYGTGRPHGSNLVPSSARLLSALDVLNTEKSLVVLGGPGSGKSTFVSMLALCMAGEMLGDNGQNLASLTAPLPQEKDDDDDDENQKPQQWDHGALLPVQVVLRDLASQLPTDGKPVNANTLWNFIAGELKKNALDTYAPHLEKELHDKGGLILLDGLDEVPDALNRREQIKQVVQEFAATFSQCRFLVTSRTYAYQRQDWKLNEFAEVQLLPFTPVQITCFVNSWYRHMAQLYRLREAAATERAEVLKRTVKQNARIRELAERPLLLTLICQLQTDGGGTLPEKREELYDKAVEMLLNKWESLKVREFADGSKAIEPGLAEWLNVGRDSIRKQLNRLAFNAHRDQPDLTGTADIPQDKLVSALLTGSGECKDVKVRRLEDYLRDRAGILTAHGVGMYQFPHRSFQEYLAACHLTDDGFPENLADLARSEPNRWREVCLLAGAKAARGASSSVWDLCEALCHASPSDESTSAAEHWGALLAGQVLTASADLEDVPARHEEKLKHLRQWQIAIMRHNVLPATERALAGQNLAILGDPRPEVMTLDGMQFCYVAPGPFDMGDDEGASNEKPQHEVHLNKPYFMARFPVTVAQWREFLLSDQRRSGDQQKNINRFNDPVVDVSWRDATEFCEFLTQRWRSQLPDGWQVTLPSEAEWEKAARGSEYVPVQPACVGKENLQAVIQHWPEQDQTQKPLQTRVYPWGDTFDPDKANAEASTSGISAVGCYSDGTSPYGCEEMSGNVLEWTRSVYGGDSGEPEFTYPYDPTDTRREDLQAGDDVLRVVRGGCWSGPSNVARCACRNGPRPDIRRYFLGFRVMLRCVPVNSDL